MGEKAGTAIIDEGEKLGEEWNWSEVKKWPNNLRKKLRIPQVRGQKGARVKEVLQKVVSYWRFIQVETTCEPTVKLTAVRDVSMKWIFVRGTGDGGMKEDSKILWRYESVQQEIKGALMMGEGVWWWGGFRGKKRRSKLIMGEIIGKVIAWFKCHIQTYFLSWMNFKKRIFRNSNIFVIFRNSILPPHGGHNLPLCWGISLRLPFHIGVSISVFFKNEKVWNVIMSFTRVILDILWHFVDQFVQLYIGLHCL